MNRSNIEDSIRAWATQRHLPAAHLQRWLVLDDASRAALLMAATELRLRTGQFVALMQLLEEISVRESEPISAVLARKEIQRVIAGAGSAPGRARSLLETLRLIRYPALSGLLRRLQEEIAALKLPGCITVLLPADLSSDEVEISITMRTEDDLNSALAALAARRERLSRIIAALGGKDEL